MAFALYLTWWIWSGLSKVESDLLVLVLKAPRFYFYDQYVSWDLIITFWIMDKDINWCLLNDINNVITVVYLELNVFARIASSFCIFFRSNTVIEIWLYFASAIQSCNTRWNGDGRVTRTFSFLLAHWETCPFGNFGLCRSRPADFG